MKVRWTSESVRFRITPSELAALQAGTSVTVALPVPGSPGWRATLLPLADGDPTPTRLRGDADGRVTVDLASPDLAALSEPQTEGVYFGGAGGDTPRFFIEKDFPCVHPRPPEAMERTETFAPPPGFSARHQTGC